MTFKPEKQRIALNRVVARNFCWGSQWTSGNHNGCTVIVKKKRRNGKKNKEDYGISRKANEDDS